MLSRSDLRIDSALGVVVGAAEALTTSLPVFGLLEGVVGRADEDAS